MNKVINKDKNNIAPKTHMDLSIRNVIELGLNNLSSFGKISEVTGKSKSTISREVKNHKIVYTPVGENFVKNNGIVYDCKYSNDCNGKEFCLKPCEKYEHASCKKRDSRGVCNGCELLKSRKCKKIKYVYSAMKAEKEYKTELIDCRSGVDLTTNQAKNIGTIVKDCLKQGQSLYTIVVNHPELGKCEKTLYNYISAGVFNIVGIGDIDLRRKVSMKPRKKATILKPRENRAYLKGRTYVDYQKYMVDHPSAKVVEMDTVYNDETNGPFIQTFHFVEWNVMIGIYHEKKTAENMKKGVLLLFNVLGEDDFQNHVQVILTDRGSEFTCADAIESTGCKIFFCDPMCSWQKPHVERNHELLRFICPKEKDLYQLGLRSQDDINLVFSHINSYVRESLHNKSPFDILTFYENSDIIIEKLNMKIIKNSDEINLTPTLIKK